MKADRDYYRAILFRRAGLVRDPDAVQHVTETVAPKLTAADMKKKLAAMHKAEADKKRREKNGSNTT
jgi:transposase-like protein